MVARFIVHAFARFVKRECGPLAGVRSEVRKLRRRIEKQGRICYNERVSETLERVPANGWALCAEREEE